MSPLSWLPESWKERLRRRAGAVTPLARLENLSRAGFRPRQIIDAGAYRGEWTEMAHRLFPHAAILLIEPQPACAPRLRELCRRIPGSRFSPAALGAQPGRATFLLQESNSRIAPPDHPPETAACEVEVQTLATLAATAGFAACDLLKLDLQGHELEALGGAGEIFGRAEVIVTEVSWLRIGPVPLVHEVHDAFRAKGYRLYDIFGFNYRPFDGALWQTDLIFVREDSRLLAHLFFT